MLQLAKLLVLILLAGSVQGQNAGDVKVMTGGGEWTWEAPYVVTIDTGIAWSKHTPHALHCYNAMDRDTVWHPMLGKNPDYWEIVQTMNGMYTGEKAVRRFGRWYPDTVQVCDTVTNNEVTRDNVSWFTYKVTCRDTTIYAKRVKKTKTEWVIPGESK